MTEPFKSDDVSAPQQTESDVLILLKKVLQQLAFLEKKVDMLLNQPQEKPFREKSFSKPFRSFDRPYRPGPYQGKREQGEGFRERDSRPGGHFEKRQEGEHRGFGGPKKDFHSDRESRPGQEGHFKKKFGGKKGGFNPGKKSFFHKRRDQ